MFDARFCTTSWLVATINRHQPAIELLRIPRHLTGYEPGIYMGFKHQK
jgi:hypothetical protein